MGKRKKSSRKPQGPKKNTPLPSNFACLFCNHESSVSVKIDKKAGIGELSCKICGQNFQTGINYLSAAVDVYSDWVDACDAVATDSAGRNDDAWIQRTSGRAGQDDYREDLEGLEPSGGLSDEEGERDYVQDEE